MLVYVVLNRDSKLVLQSKFHFVHREIVNHIFMVEIAVLIAPEILP